MVFRMGDDRDRPLSLYVNNIPYDCQADEIRELFDRYGRIRDVYLPRDYYTRRPRGFAYVEFEDIRDAEDAMESMHRRRFHGRELVVEWAKGGRKTGDQMRATQRDEDRDRDRDRGSRRRSPSPRRRRSPSPSYRRRRSRSRSRSPIRRRSPSPRRRHHSPSPRRRSPSPSPQRRRRSPSPRRKRRSPTPDYEIRDEANGRDDEPETP